MTNTETMLIDCHAHTPKVSPCCKGTVEGIILETKNKGIDGIILTNHYSGDYIGPSKRYADSKEMAQDHINEYKKVKALGEERNFGVLFGVEISMTLYKYVHLLVYGVDEDFLFNNLDMYDYTQERLYKAVKEAGGVLVQAHPLRAERNLLLDPNFLDGIEINSHLLYEGTHYEELSEFARKNRLILTSGGDYHVDAERPHCGMHLPKSIKNTKDFAKYLCTTDSVHLLMQEPDQTESYERIFVKEKSEL